MPYLQSNLDDHGRVSISVGGSSRQTLTSDPSCAAIFTAAGLPARHEDKMALWLRCHVPLGVAFESIAVAGKRRGKGAAWRRAQTIALGLSACYRLVRREGYEIYPVSKKRLDRLPVSLIATMLWGLSHVAPFRNLLATGEAECWRSCRRHVGRHRGHKGSTSGSRCYSGYEARIAKKRDHDRTEVSHFS